MASTGGLSSDEEGQPLVYAEDEDAPIGCLVGCCCSCIPSGSVGVVQKFGEYVGYQNPGCLCYCPPFYSVQKVSLMVEQLDCSTECKTKDNVTLSIKTALQYRINKNMIKSAVFDIASPKQQMHAYVDNVVRSSMPEMDLDDAYANKETLCSRVLHDVRAAMAPYGYNILNVLVTDLAPERSVLDAMNAINAAKRHRVAALEQGEAQKTLMVKQAEAEAEAKYLSGVGVARMRRAIADGFKESISSMSQGGLSPQQAMHMMITTQYFDTLNTFASNPSNNAIMVPHGPGVVSDIESQVRNGFVQGTALSSGSAPPQAIMMPMPSQPVVQLTR